RVTIPPTPHLIPLSLHDALPISILFRHHIWVHRLGHVPDPVDVDPEDEVPGLDVQVLESDPAVDAGIVVQDIDPAVLLDDIVHRDRKSTRLNSSHVSISYAVFCL